MTRDPEKVYLPGEWDALMAPQALHELVRLARYIQDHFARETPAHEPPVTSAIRLLDELRERRRG